MARIRSLRQWWRGSVLGPLDAIYTRIDGDESEANGDRAASDGHVHDRDDRELPRLDDERDESHHLRRRA